MVSKNNGFSISNLSLLMNKAQDNLNALHARYKSFMENNSELGRLEQEREAAIQKLNQEFDKKIEKAKMYAPEIVDIREEANKQINSFHGFQETLKMLNVSGAAEHILVVPEEFKDLNKVIQEVKNLPNPNNEVAPYKTIEASMKQMFVATKNAPKKPIEIINYLTKTMGLPHAEASIRTQLFNMKKDNKVIYNADFKTYQWAFTSKEKKEMGITELSSV